MKILVFIHSLSGGGAERVTTSLAAHWAKKGRSITVVTLTSSDCDFFELHSDVKRIALNLADDSGNMLVGLVQNLRRIIALRRVIRQTEPDLAIGMMATANVLLALATLGLSPLRSIGSERTHPPAYPLGILWNWLRRVSYMRLTAVTALTYESAVWLKEHTGARLVAVIPNPTSWPLPTQAPRIIPESFCDSGRQMLLAVGRLSEEKQFDVLLDAFRALADQYPSWDLVILGEGPLRPMLHAQLRMMSLDHRVFLPGRAGNMRDWYERADLFVMSSRFEGFPNALVEALAHGLPAVSFDCDTGPRDIIRSEVDGLLVPGNDVVKMTAALARLMGDADLRARYAERAVEARERFSMGKIAKMWEELFDKVVT